MNLNKLKAKMVEGGFTQRSLAERMGVSKNTINAIFTSSRMPRVDEAKELCDILQIDTPEERNDIFFGK